MSVHRHGSPQRQSGSVVAVTGSFRASYGAHRPCKHLGCSGAPANSRPRVDRKNPPSFPGDAVLVSLGIGRADCGDCPSNRGYYMAGFRRSFSLYRTLSDAGSGPAAGRVHLQVVFADDITEREIRTLLSSTGATIVAGPTPMAVYTLALAGDDRGGPARTRETLEVLRAHPKVRLAEVKQP